MSLPSEKNARFTRRQALKLGLGGAAALGAGLAGWRLLGPTAYRGPFRHVVFVSLDTIRQDHLGCYGKSGVKTPAIDALAAESIVYTGNITPVTSTLASHTSMVTGKYPQDHGARRNGYLVPAGNVLLAEILRDIGFTTAGFIGAFPLDQRFGIARGFDYYDGRFDIAAETGGPDQDQRRAVAVTGAALRYLDREGVPDHLFLFAHYFDAHIPYDAPEPFGSLYAPTRNPMSPDLATHPVLSSRKISPEDVAGIRSYCGEISYVDSEVGRLLLGLKTRGILDEALVVLTSDHGEMLACEEIPYAFSHGWTVYDGEVRTALMFRLPGARHGGTRHEELTSNIDILPTLAHSMGLPTPAGVSGAAFDLLAGGTPPANRTLFAEATKPGEAEAAQRWPGARRSECACRGPLKYVLRPMTRTEALFDTALDPHERTNLLDEPDPEHRKTAAGLREALASWRASARPVESGYAPDEDGDARNRLKGFGYVR